MGQQKREREQRRLTLVVLLQALIGQTVTVDLRNETVVTGKLDNVEDDMTMAMSDAVEMPFLGQSSRHERFVIVGKQIRYVHIPDSVDVRKTLDRHEKKLAYASQRYVPRRKPKATTVKQ